MDGAKIDGVEAIASVHGVESPCCSRSAVWAVRLRGEQVRERRSIEMREYYRDVRRRAKRHSLPEHSDMALKRVSILAERDSYRAFKYRSVVEANPHRYAASP
jgi:hypothetical protein